MSTEPDPLLTDGSTPQLASPDAVADAAVQPTETGAAPAAAPPSAIPIDKIDADAYTTGDPLRHDLAVPLPPLAGLQAARELAHLSVDSDLYKFTAAALVREENRAVHALDEASDLIDDLLASKELS